MRALRSMIAATCHARRDAVYSRRLLCTSSTGGTSEGVKGITREASAAVLLSGAAFVAWKASDSTDDAKTAPLERAREHLLRASDARARNNIGRAAAELHAALGFVRVELNSGLTRDAHDEVQTRALEFEIASQLADDTLTAGHHEKGAEILEEALILLHMLDRCIEATSDMDECTKQAIGALQRSASLRLIYGLDFTAQRKHDAANLGDAAEYYARAETLALRVAGVHRAQLEESMRNNKRTPAIDHTIASLLAGVLYNTAIMLIEISHIDRKSLDDARKNLELARHISQNDVQRNKCSDALGLIATK